MTDKQIIIDGCDVSGCGELVKQDENTLICEITGYLCEDRQNCHYKQLKRKEQENEELKEINQELLKYRKHSTTCQECYEDGLEDGKLDNKELRKLRKTLAEIKEIAEDFYLDGEYVKVKYLAQDILQKINEVDNEKI
jgi:hypothetical protein